MNHVTKMYLNTHQVARTLLSFSFHCHVWRIRDYNAYVMCVCTLISQGNQAAATTKIPITLLKSTVKLCILNCTKQGRAEQRCPLSAAHFIMKFAAASAAHYELHHLLNFISRFVFISPRLLRG